MYNILVVEDELKIAQTVMDYLRREGYAVLHAATIAEALKLVSSDIDLIVLDLMLPDGQGEDLCAHVVGLYNTPVIMLTSKRSEQSRINGFASGADDYLAKPFARAELLARVLALGRRSGHGQTETIAQNVLRIDGLELDLLRRRASRDGVRLDLTAKEFTLLALLMRKQGEVLSRLELAEQVWDINFNSNTNVVEVAIRRLRGKVDEPFDKKLLHTVRGMGYVLEPRSD